MQPDLRYVALDMPVWWHAGEADVRLVVDDHQALLMFDVAADPTRLAAWLFPSYRDLRYGAPSSDTFAKHPLGRAGAQHFGAYEILDSEWLRQRSRPTDRQPRHHYFLHLGDKSLELLATRPEAYACSPEMRDGLRLQDLLNRCVPWVGVG